MRTIIARATTTAHELVVRVNAAFASVTAGFEVCGPVSARLRGAPYRHLAPAAVLAREPTTPTYVLSAVEVTDSVHAAIIASTGLVQLHAHPHAPHPPRPRLSVGGGVVLARRRFCMVMLAAGPVPIVVPL